MARIYHVQLSMEQLHTTEINKIVWGFKLLKYMKSLIKLKYKKKGT